MKKLFVLLRFRPLFSAALVMTILCICFLSWRPLGLGPQRLPALLVLAALLALWPIAETVYFLLQRRQRQRTVAGQLVIRCEAALAQAAVAGTAANSFLAMDQLCSLPWVLVFGPAGSGKSSLLERAGCRRIANCAPDAAEDGKARCTFWLSPEYPVLVDATPLCSQALCIELAGDTLHDESGEQLVRWLLTRRGQLSALLLVLSLDDLGKDDEGAPEELSTELGQFIRRIARLTGSELAMHVALTKCDRLEGYTSFFGRSGSGVWGLSCQRALYDRDLGAELQIRFAQVEQALWQLTAPALLASSGQGGHEALIDFPRELARRYAQAQDLLLKLGQHLSAEASVRLGELYLVSATQKDAQVQLAQRLRRIPLGTKVLAEPRPGSTAYFTSGALERVVRLAEPVARPRQRRQTYAFGALLMLGLFVIGLVSHQQFSRLARLRQLQQAVASLARSLDELRLNVQRIEPHPRWAVELEPNLTLEFTRDAAVREASTRIESIEPSGSAPLLESRRALLAAVQRYQHVRTAHRLFCPILRYDQADEESGIRDAQPLYGRLRLLTEQPRGQRAEDRAALLNGFFALKLATLLERHADCPLGDAELDWAASYLVDLWTGSGAPMAQPVVDSLRQHLRSFLGEFTSARPYPLLVADPRQLRRARQALSRQVDSARAALAGGASSDTAAVEFSLLLAERSLAAGGRLSLPLQFFQNDRPLAPEYTSSGCALLASGGADRSQTTRTSWVSCVLSTERGFRADAASASMQKYYQNLTSRAWSDWLAGLQAPTPTTLVAAYEGVQRLGSDLDTLFKSIGTAAAVTDKSATPALCHHVQRPFAPLRWAVAGTDNLGDLVPEELPASYTRYKQSLAALVKQLEPLTRASVPPAELVQGFTLAGESLSQVTAQRRAFLTALEGALLSRENPLRLSQTEPGTAAAIPGGHLGMMLAHFEDSVWATLIERMRLALDAQWAESYRTWRQALPQTKETREAATGEAEATRLRIQEALQSFRQSFIKPFVADGDVERCEPVRLGNGAPSPGRSVLCAETCRLLAVPLRVLRSPLPPRAAEASTPPPMDPPSLFVSQTGQCGSTWLSSIELELPELGKRYRCSVSANVCQDLGPSQSRRPEIAVLWRDRATPERLPSLAWDTLAVLVARTAQLDARGALRTERDPGTNRARSWLRLPIPNCSGLELRLFLDTPVLRRALQVPEPPPLPAFLDPAFLPNPERFASCRHPGPEAVR